MDDFVGFVYAFLLVFGAPITIIIGLAQLSRRDKESREIYRQMSPEQKAIMTEKEFVTRRSSRKNATIEEILDVPKLVTCPLCGQQVSNKAAACPKCGQPVAEAQCPICGSKNVKVVSSAEKFGSMVVWGSLSANKVLNKYECQDCYHKF